MPSYDYVCKDCSERFEVRASVTEYSNGIKPHCPKCQSRNVIRGFSPISIVGSPRGTFGPSGCCGPGGGGGCCGPRT